MNKIHLYSCLALMVACGNPAKKDNMKEDKMKSSDSEMKDDMSDSSDMKSGQ